MSRGCDILPLSSVGLAILGSMTRQNRQPTSLIALRLTIALFIVMLGTSACLPANTRSDGNARATDLTSSSSAGEASSLPTPRVREGVVLRVVDGDTAHIAIDGVREKVRFIGVDTPESTIEIEPFGKTAAAFTNKSLPRNTRVWVETDVEQRDRYGRLLAYVWTARPVAATDEQIRAKMFNARLALEGYAQQMTVPPNVRYADYFYRYVGEARGAERGLWSTDPGASTASPGSGSESPSKSLAGAARAATKVFVTATGRRYHRSTCASLSRSKRSISLDEALSQGYEPCGVCKPAH